MKRILTIGIGVIVIAIIIYTFKGSSGQNASLKAEVEQARQEQIDFLKNNDDSPFNDSIPFEGLKFYPVKNTFKVKAQLTPVDFNKELLLTNNKGGKERFLKYAYANFKINGKSCRLVLLRASKGRGSEQLFIPFTDQTNGDETYGAGRYLEVDVPQNDTGSLTLDFNKAFNPYCAYNSEYVCPMPPKENRLDVPVPAGEKSYAN